MKIHTKPPDTEPELLIVKPDQPGAPYAIWMLAATKLGDARWLGRAKVECDGETFANLKAAGKHLLVKQGIQSAGGLELTGLDMIERNVWFEFCRLRKLKPSDKAAMDKKYWLSAEDIKKIGLK